MTDKGNEPNPRPGDGETLPTISGTGASGTSDAEPEAGEPVAKRVIDDFEILEEVGRGGMGVVYRAFERSLKRVVALKVLLPEIAGNASAAKRFRREAVLAANLSHPNIVPVFQVDPRELPTYFAMEFVLGRSLKDKVESEGYLPPDEAVRITLQAVEALECAHQQHIVHRDIKPSNILLQNHVERVRVTDFGIARDMTGQLADVTMTEGTSAGTPAFMSPEQNLGTKLDARTDIFSLGMTLYYMLTGRVAFRAKNRQKLVVAFREQTPQPPSRLNPAVDVALDRLVMKMIAIDRRQRYPDCGELLRALEALENGPVRRRRWSLRGVGHVTVHRAAAAVFWVAAGLALLAMVWPTLRGTGARGASFRVEREISLPGLVTSWPGALLGEWDGDGEPDLFAYSDTDLFTISDRGQILGKHKVIRGSASEVHLDLVEDIDGDGRDEIFAGWAEGEDLVLALLNQNFYELKRFKAKGTVYNGPGGQGLLSGMMAACVVDLEQDGSRELIAMLNTGYGRKPRGICCFDLEEGELLWEYHTGGVPAKVIPVDVNCDGKLDIVFSTGAMGNGNEAEDGTSDAYSYACALSNEGKLLWVRKLGELGSVAHLMLVDLNGDTTGELLAWVSGSPDWNEQSASVVLLGSDGQIVSRYEPGGQVFGCVVSDLDSDGTREVLVSDQQGFLHVLDSRLHLKRKVKIVSTDHDYVRLSVKGVLDLDGDGRTEVVLTSAECEVLSARNPGLASRERNVRFYHNNSIIVLDSSLERVAEHVLAGKWKDHIPVSVVLRRWGKGGVPKILALADRAVLLSLVKN